MKYMNVLMACAAEPWALEKTKLLTIANFLRFKAMGGNYSAEEVARITQKREREVAKADGAIGIVPVYGVIGERMNMLDDVSGGTSTELISKQFRALLNNDAVKAIVLDINSPGGVARSVEELAQEIFEARGIKPIVAQINTCAASAGYWIASQADEIVASPSCLGGGIGVYTIHEDISELLAKEGIKNTIIYSGQYKTIGNEFEPLGAEAKSIMQKRVDELAASFVRSVARGRGVSAAAANERFGEGLVFGAQELVDRGMADRVAPMSATLERFGVTLNPALARARAGSLQAPEHAEEGSEKFRRRIGDWSRRINDGETPPPSEFEDILRDAGVAKSTRARLASRMHAALRSESGGNDEAATALDRLRIAAGAFSTPT